jgi:hypothetical protein
MSRTCSFSNVTRHVNNLLLFVKPLLMRILTTKYRSRQQYILWEENTETQRHRKCCLWQMLSERQNIWNCGSTCSRSSSGAMAGYVYRNSKQKAPLRETLLSVKVQIRKCDRIINEITLFLTFEMENVFFCVTNKPKYMFCVRKKLSHYTLRRRLIWEEV